MAQYNILGYETLDIEDSAVSLTGGVTGARSFVGKLETGAVRSRGDGTAPTASEGVLFSVGDVIVLGQYEIAAMQFIRDTSTSGILKGHYYSAEPTAFSSGGFA